MGRAAAKARSPIEHGWVRAAVLGGIVAGIVSNMVLTLCRLLIGLGWSLIVWLIFGPWRPGFERSTFEELWVALKISAFPFVGERALDAGLDAPIVLLGIVSRLVFSIGSGVLFGLIAHGRSHATTVALGMLFAILYWAGSSYLITPPILGSLARLVEFVPYGLALAYTLLWCQGRCVPRRLRRWWSR